MTAAAAPAPDAKSGGLLDIIEKVGNKVPHPVLMFLYLIIVRDRRCPRSWRSWA